jgi:hypothetical protein
LPETAEISVARNCLTLPSACDIFWLPQQILRKT